MASYRQNVNLPPPPTHQRGDANKIRMLLSARCSTRTGRWALAYEELRLKEFERDRDGSWVDEIPDGNDHSIDAVRYAMMDDVLRGV